MKIAITGHQPGRISGHEQDIKEWIKNYLTGVDCTEAYSGMAMGVELGSQ